MFSEITLLGNRISGIYIYMCVQKTSGTARNSFWGGGREMKLNFTKIILKHYMNFFFTFDTSHSFITKKLLRLKISHPPTGMVLNLAQQGPKNSWKSFIWLINLFSEIEGYQASCIAYGSGAFAKTERWYFGQNIN